MEIKLELNYEEPKWKKIKSLRLHINNAVKETIFKIKDLQHSSISIVVSILLSNDVTMQNLNFEYRKKNYPTNVLSFFNQCFDIEAIKSQDEFFIGDLAFGYNIIKNESISQNKSFIDHFTHLVVHGILHLFGYDHEEEEERNIMERLEIIILNNLNIKNPYE